MTLDSDDRVAWIRERVLHGLGLEECEFKRMLEVTSENSGKSGGVSTTGIHHSATDILRGFLGAKTGVGSSIFFYTEKEEVEESEEYEEEYQEMVPLADQHNPSTESGADFALGVDVGDTAMGASPISGDVPHIDTEREASNGVGTDSGDTLDGGLETGTEGRAVVEAPQPFRMETRVRLATRLVISTKLRCRVMQGTLPDTAHKVIYFVKNVSGEVARPPSASIYDTMIMAMEHGFLTGDCLTNLSTVIKDVFTPLLDHQLGLGMLLAPGNSGEKPPADVTMLQDAPRVGDTLRNEFRANLQKFESHVTHATQQVKGDVHLNVPNLNIDDPDIGNDFEAVSLLEGAMEDWSRLITSVVEAENVKRVKGKGPMAEIEFWRRRNASLSALYEQINMPKVQKMLKVMDELEAPMLPTFNYHFSELSKLYIEAKDNVKFLTTLERHFKNIGQGSLSTTLDTLPSMMNAIRMVWVISRHYNTDERMVPLMELIAGEIASKVETRINIRTILMKSPEAAKNMITEARKVLESWHATYMDVRHRIEESGTDHRWEFDRKRLFEQTNYMARVCGDLLEVATVLDQFHKFLGPELKAVTGESAGIDGIMERVDGLALPLNKVPFDIFDMKYKDSWHTVMQHFRQQVEEIEDMTKSFIEQSFQKLRSAEGAFELVQNFQNIQSRDSIHQQINERYKDILSQYTKELDHINNIFNTYKASPPIYKNYPAVAGAIAWARDLYNRAKKPILRFKAHDGLLTSTFGEQVKQRYLVFAHAVDSYSTRLYVEWEQRVGAVATEKLKQPILCSSSVYGTQQRQEDGQDGEGLREQGSALNHLAKVSKVTLHQPSMENKNPRMPLPPYGVNFAAELFMIIRESKYLDLMGFQVPEAALNVALQEDKYHKYIQDLQHMLKNYDALVGSLTHVETCLLSRQLQNLQAVLLTGFTPLNWNSQRIPSFIETCNKALNEFSGIVSQIHKSSTMIREVVSSIENMLLMQEKDFISPEGPLPPMDVAEFYDTLDTKRLARLDGLVQQYNSIESLLIKVEEVVAGTNTGMSPLLAGYYHYWEKNIFNAITKCIISSMATFLALLQSKDRPPLCEVKATLNGKDLVVTPTVNDIYKYLTKSVKNMVESARMFVRWMHGTCCQTAPQVFEEEEPFIFSFYQDMSQNPHVIKLMLQLNQAIHKVFSMMNKYLDGWRRYDTVYNLWNPKRKQALDKLAEKNHTCVYFDTRIASYELLAETVRAQPSEKDVEFIRIDCYSVAVGIAAQADQWKIDYGAVLHQCSSVLLEQLCSKMTELEEDLQGDPDNLDALKFVLNTIADVCGMGMDVELSILDVMERYRTLHHYCIPVPEEEMTKATKIADRWQSLFLEAKTKDLCLVKVKEQFREVTKRQALEFHADLKDMEREFKATGPGNSSTDLEDGARLLAEYEERVQACTMKKLELVNAEGLFGLGITDYPELNRVSAELKRLSRIYDLYREQREFEEGNGATPWADLDVGSLQRGVEDLEKKARKEKQFKEHPTFRAVETRIFNFKDSIPLITNLKNDAMKPRHWEKLIEMTGVKFDASNFKSLTLGNIFQMELHRFTADIDEIVNESVQELKIENEIRKIEATWRKTELVLAKYTKNGVDRSYVLRAADDIKMELEDNMLNLQTMAGSRFVGSFADQVRGWERTLNLVNETLDMWYTVQRKWMYLESIFIGAEDIRLQLPEEAKKFDAIDKAFKQIMTQTYQNPNVTEACTADNRLEALESLSERLDLTQKSLSDYLDTKRNSFPRFFFISDDELLSVLGSSDPTSIQAGRRQGRMFLHVAEIQVHLLKLFDNVKTLTFGRGNKQVVGMGSSEGEKFSLREFVPIEGPVENWMTSVEGEMGSSLRAITKEGVYNYAQEERQTWITTVIGMVSLVGSQIWWTWEVEDVFQLVAGGNKYAMKNLAIKLTSQLNDLVALVREELTSHARKKVNTLLIIDVHARDIVDGFVRESILNAKEFAWESQLRFYWDRDIDDCIIRQCTGKFSYGYEYMGMNGRLVITPLTDRCYMTLTQALTFKLGGAPAGPAGTGKTETTKDLAKSLALPCFVINCGEGLDYKAMGSIFAGLVQAGAWGCFDEFNRINIEVLSVVSAQLKAIQNSLVSGKPTVDIGVGGEIRIKRVAGFATCGVFITMNPGYAGRTELPDNLKALFRPVTMIVPDLLQICEIMLFSEGFEGAKVLAKKMTVLYKLSKEQLSKQFHYDFGLRALKSVLVMAGGLKRQYAEMPEDLVLMRALRDSNMPKFVFEDVPLFKGLINDLFPGMDCPRVGYEDLKLEVAKELEAGGYRCHDDLVFNDQVDKCIQMYETQIVRHTTMIVGPTGGGKSLILETLKNARLPAEGVIVKMYVLNAKKQPLNELYGVMDPVTRDWTDGILSKLFRELNEPLPSGRENELRLIVFDGDVDAVWVENMNSVMDDNKLLTLPNGERIRLQPHCALVCETFDLQYASPATISRCGMVWVDPKNLGYAPYYERWVRLRCGDGVTISEDRRAYADLLLLLFEKYVGPCVDYVLSGLIDGQQVEKLRQVIPITNLDLVKQLCSSLEAFLGTNAVEDSTDVEGIYMFCIVWSIGAALVKDSRDRFDAFVKKMSGEATPNDSLYCHFYSADSHKWEKWQSRVPEYCQPDPFHFYEIMVPTTDSVLYTHLLETLAPQKPLLLVGESGTAKTVTIQKYMAGLAAETTARLVINFSSRTTAKNVQANIEGSIDKRAGSTYGPPSGKTLVVFVDDMNMPKVDTYGTQQPIALLLFLMSKGSLYDRGKDLNLKYIKDLSYIAAMGPPGGGRNNVDPRFVALFNVYNLIEPSESVLSLIYTSIITQKLVNFSEPVKEVGAKITDATLKLYQIIVERLPPTPSKFHYIFNLRDLSRVYEGICLATEDTFNTSKSLVRLWRNECLRVFGDRLFEEDMVMLNSEIESTINTAWPACADHATSNPLLLGDYAEAIQRLVDDGEDPQLYQDLGDYERTRKIFDEVLENYNLDHKPMNLVLFESALDHLTRIYRIIRMPRGNAMLVGVGGSGKKSLTQLAAYCAGYKVFSISLVRNYGELEFRDDLKELYKLLGVGPVVFLFTDAHVVEEGFLEFINNMLTTGMVPALFEKDETDQCINSVRKEVKAAGLIDTPDTCWNYFVNKCRNNLHVVLAMSPSGDKLRIRCRSFPGLVSASVIDWFQPWPSDALQKVAEYFLQDEQLPDNLRDTIIGHLVFTHQTVVEFSQRFAEEMRRYYYVTPANYLDYIANYRTELKGNNRTIEGSVKRLEGGLTKLIEAADAVDQMQIELSEKKIVVDEKTKNVEAMITEIQAKSEVANKQQADASVKQQNVQEQSVVISKEKALADEALMEALPIVEAAAAALENLDKKDLDEIKAFTNPPQLVKDVSMQCCVLRPGGEKYEETWADAKKMLSNSKLLDNLKNYPKDSITEKMIKAVKRYFKNPNLTVDNMKSVSKAGLGLLSWVAAITKYYDIAKNVEPLRLKVRDMEKAQQQATKELAELMDLLSKLNSEISELNMNYETANGELSQLQLQASLMEKRLTAASKLITGLTGERTRWTVDIGDLQQQQTRLVGDCLLASSFLSYLGAFTTEYRADLVYGRFFEDLVMRQVPVMQPFHLEDLLTTDATVQGWVAKGLPADEHSVQNGILTTKASRFPLCVDPQQQAVSWIKNTYEGSNLTVKSLNEPDFMKHLELAIQFGNPFLFENIDEELDPMLDPVLEKNVVQDGPSKTIKLGDKVVDWDDGFRLFFTTKLANPNYSPEVMGKTMLINYGVTMDGLANQLLNVVVAHERQDLEESYAVLVHDMSENAQLIVQLEDTLLKELSNSQGNILDNQELIQTLENTKTKAEEIKVELEKAAFTKEEIGDARAVYKPVAKRGSILYFAEAGLAAIMSMYEISLDSFLGVFSAALDAAKRDVVLDSRINNMVNSVTRNIYDYTCTGIFERHKLMFSFQMTCMILDGDGNLSQPELDFFLKGDVSLDGATKTNSAPWLSDQGWKDLLCLASMGDVYRDLVDHFGNNTDSWQDWQNCEAPEDVGFPGNFNEQLQPLQKLCVTRCFRPDRVYNAVKIMVMETMGDTFVQPPVLDYNRIFYQSSPSMPMVFILSPGADPQSDIQSLGDELGFTGNKFKFISLGQGQGPLAELMMEQGYQKGHWVLLQNCHLLASWLKNLEKSLELMKSPHKDFRLWLTTEPTDKFPLGILQRSLKVVTEPPDGLKLNMRSTYSKIDQSIIDECPHWAFRPCLYVLAFLHAVVLERRKYGKIGWNVKYDFNESDLLISRRLLSLYLAKAFEDGDEFLPWGSLKYLIGDAMYGGRVSDDMDRRVLVTYLQEYMGDFLFDDCQKFFFSRAGYDYELPEWGPMENYMGMIENLPLINSPAVFGLHPNAEIGYYTNATKEMWKNLISLQPRKAGGEGGMSREDLIASIAKDIESKVPIQSMDVGSYDLMNVRRKIIGGNGGEAPSPCQVVLMQELERWNALVIKMATSLMDLRKALTGEIGMSDELDGVGDSLYNGFLPSTWRRLCPNTQKPLGTWMLHFSKRYKQYEGWLAEGEPAAMWLSGLHIPESYLTALVQTTCRIRHWPLDKSTLYTHVTQYKALDDIPGKLESGCFVTGLYLEGAAWDIEESCLVRQNPKILVTELPALQIIPIEASKLKLQSTFKTPVYVTQDRRNAMGVGLVFEADLRTFEHPSHWVLQGVALSLNTDT
ncbi:unnamed protein product [Choristocarpus tenellus]